MPVPGDLFGQRQIVRGQQQIFRTLPPRQAETPVTGDEIPDFNVYMRRYGVFGIGAKDICDFTRASSPGV